MLSRKSVRYMPAAFEKAAMAGGKYLARAALTDKKHLKRTTAYVRESGGAHLLWE